MEAMICKRCGAPLHGDQCEYCKVEYKRPEVTFIPDDTTIEVSPEELRRIRCDEEFFRNPRAIYVNGYQGEWRGMCVKLVPESKNIFVSMLEKGAITKEEFIRLTGSKE